MRSFILTAAVLAFPVASQAATFGSFEGAVSVSMTASPFQELGLSQGILPPPSSVVTSGDVTTETGDDGVAPFCCNEEDLVGPGPLPLGDVALSARADVNSDGSAILEGQRRGIFAFGNFGAETEAVTLTFDVSLSIAQMVDPIVGGAARSAIDLVIARDGTEIFTRALASAIDDGANNEALMENFSLSFDLLATDDFSTEFEVSLFGGVGVSSNASDILPNISAVPLPGGSVLLLSGLVGLGVARKRRSSAA